MNATDFTDIQGAAAVDLSNHAVIEASAGTGKTYTLIELVMRLIIEDGMRIESILLVTFTEQATGELKARIRQRLREALAQTNGKGENTSLVEHLEDNIAQLNQASIFTIHGFCHGALKEFAFEQGAVFEAEMVNDYDVRSLMLQQMKRQWPADAALIKQLQAFTQGDKSLASVDTLLLDLANKYKPEFDTLYPVDFEFEFMGNLSNDDGIINPDFSELEDEFNSLKGIKSTSYKNLWLKVMQPFMMNLSSLLNSTDCCEKEVINLFNVTFLNKEDVNEVFFKSCPAIYKDSHKDQAVEYNQSNAPELFSLIDGLNLAWQKILNQHKNSQFQAIPKLLDELIQASGQYKRERGLISYDDMVFQLWQKLKQESELAEDEQLLTQALRSKYQVAIIDEFQDTDIRQWQIFEQLFLRSPQVETAEQHRLWVIGDPKQAIYGFRGADIHTYEAAKSSMVEQYRGKAYRLATNFRTTRALIAELNRFFADNNGGQTDAESGGWFAPAAVHVHAPTADIIDVKETPQIIESKYSLNAFNCLQVDWSSADEMKSQLAEKIALTIKNQIIDQVEVQQKGQQRVLDAADVCILVRGNADAVFIEEALQKQHIPYTFHKKKDLYQSDEAIHYQVMLTALARPNEVKRVNNALLTLFFGLKPDELADFAAEQLPEITALWLQVKEAVLAKDWIQVFELLLHDSGAMFRARHEARNSSRRVANLKQLKNMLLKAALQNNYGADALLKYFTKKRAASSDDEDLHHKDTEQQAVKIMTMHISKGLEFPVVFLFGGFSQGGGDSFLQFYDEARKGMVYDLVKQHQDIYNVQQLKHAEQLYYVAMTRAIFMLFLPHVDETETKVSRPGLYTKTVMSRLNETGQFQLQPPDVDEPMNHQLSAASDKTMPEYSLSLPTNLKARRRNLHSFSSLSRFNSQNNHAAGNDFDHSLTAELMQSESQAQVSNSSQDTEIQQAPQIPGGVKTGHVLHGIFEHIDFTRITQHNSVESVYQDDEIMQVIDQQMKLFKLENREFEQVAKNQATERSTEHPKNLPKDYRQQLADWTWHTLNKPLDALSGQKLANVPTTERSHELSFFWSHDSTYLTGFIDLFFAVPEAESSDGLTDYYILDWKSNFSANGYTPEVLENEVMVQHQYNWQYQLYAMAMQQWFDALGLKNARLKGAIYLFSRGIDCQETMQNGVFFDDFSVTNWQVEEIRSELLHIDVGVKS